MDNELVLLTDGPLVHAADLEDVLGWTLKPEGLCRDDTCVIVRDRAAIEVDGKINVAEVAGLLDRPVAVDEETNVVAIGSARDQRRRALNDLEAPDFRLPDLDGNYHALSDHRSKKRLIAAFASW